MGRWGGLYCLSNAPFSAPCPPPYYRPMMRPCLFALGLALLLPVSAAEAARYYVGPGGSNARSQSQARNRSTPWRTIQKGINQAGAGDEIIVLAGTYYEDVFIGKSGYAGNEITLKSESREGARLIGSISSNDQRYLKVDGFDVSNYSSTGLTKGISFRRCHHVTVRDCRVRECWGGGISFDQSDWILCEWNLTHGNAFNNPAQHSGISVYQPQYRGVDSRAYGIIIRNNTSFGNWNHVNNPDFGRPTDGNGIVVDDYFNEQPGGNGVRYNRMTTIENNICFDNGGQGIHCYKSQNIRIRNNTCVNNVGSFDFGGEISVSRSERVYVYNNILVARSGKKAILQWASNNFWFGFNVIDGPTQDVPYDASNIYGAPVFQSGSFQLESYSPAVNSGASGGDHFFLDAYGQQRENGSIDRGAIEVQ